MITQNKLWSNFHLVHINVFFYKQHLHSIWNWQKIKQMLSNTLRLNFCYLKVIHVLHPRFHSKIIEDIYENKQKNKCVFNYEIIQLIIIKMKMKMKNRSHRYGIIRTKKKYKRRLTMMMLMRIKQHLDNIWSSIHEKGKQIWV